MINMILVTKGRKGSGKLFFLGLYYVGMFFNYIGFIFIGFGLYLFPLSVVYQNVDLLETQYVFYSGDVFGH